METGSLCLLVYAAKQRKYLIASLYIRSYQVNDRIGTDSSIEYFTSQDWTFPTTPLSEIKIGNWQSMGLPQEDGCVYQCSSVVHFNKCYCNEEDYCERKQDVWIYPQTKESWRSKNNSLCRHFHKLLSQNPHFIFFTKPWILNETPPPSQVKDGPIFKLPMTCWKNLIKQVS